MLRIRAVGRGGGGGFSRKIPECLLCLRKKKVLSPLEFFRYTSFAGSGGRKGVGRPTDPWGENKGEKEGGEPRDKEREGEEPFVEMRGRKKESELPFPFSPPYLSASSGVPSQEH